MRYVIKKSNTVKDLDYYKAKLKEFLKKKYSSKIEKSINEDPIFLKKARGFSVGTIREWKGKKYKKMGSGKWVRYYTQSEGRGVKQALRNTLRKIDNAKSLSELAEIVRDNMKRFHDENGKPSEIVKELLSAARGTDTGKKELVQAKENNPDRILKNTPSSNEILEILKDKGLYNKENYASFVVPYEDIRAEEEKIRESKDPEEIKKYKEYLKEDVSDFMETIQNTRGEDKQKRKERSDKGTSRSHNADGSFDMSEIEAKEITDKLNSENSFSNVEYSMDTEDDESFFFSANIDRGEFTQSMTVNPYDLIRANEKDKAAILELEISEENKDVEPETPKTDYEKEEKKVEVKNSFSIGDKVEVSGKEGKISYVNKTSEPIMYTVTLNDGSTVEAKEVSIIPYTGKKAQKSIQDANPENRTKKTMEVSGTVEEKKTEEEMVSSEDIAPFKPTNKDYNITITPIKSYATDDKPAETKKIAVEDYTEAKSMQIKVLPFSSVKEKASEYFTESSKRYQAIEETMKATKPEAIPAISYVNFERNSHTLVFAKIGDNQYILPKDQNIKTKKRFSNPYQLSPEEIVSENDFYVVNLDVLAATQDYYRKVGKSFNDISNDFRQKRMDEMYPGRNVKAKKSRMKVLASNKMLYTQQYIQGYFMADERKSYWETYGELSKELQQKTWDLVSQQEEIDNTYSKGRETAYGDSGISNELQDQYGVKIKRQDGSELSKEDVKYISDAISDVQKSFGERKSLNEKYGLKVSYAKGTMMHARKALGLFLPTMNTIAFTDGKGIKRKNPATGEMETVDYGDEKHGGFVLSHEYAHMMDSYIGKKSGSWYSSDNYNSPAGKIANTFRNKMSIPKNKKNKPGYWTRTCECFARAMEQYHAQNIEGNLAMSSSGNSYGNSTYYCNAETFNKEIKPLIEDFFKENDSLLKSISVFWD